MPPTGRPKLTHEGFLIPNAGDVSNPRMAEPDRVDFNTLAHPLWGVIDDCLVTVAGTNASTAGGTLLVNGVLVTLRAGSVGLGVGGTQDRFDLLVSDAGGTLTVISGTQAVDPVFPDPPLNVTVLAAVFCPTAATSLVDNVIDKRKFINKALLTKIGTGEDLVRNLNGTGNHYRLDGGGAMTWENDLRAYRSAPYELTVDKHLIVNGTLTAGDDVITAGDVRAAGNLYGTNLRWNTVAPTGSADPATIWQNKTSGRIYVYRAGVWQELATISSANPPGTVITSFESPSVMSTLGWIPLDGRTVYEDTVPSLFLVQGLAYLIRNTSPRSMALPNASKLMLVTDWSRNAGVKVSTHINNMISLTVDNLARHEHRPRAELGGGANPRVTMTRAGNHVHNIWGGEHVHYVTDPGHAHNGMDGGNGIASGVICVYWGGQNKIDALFNDRNHTYSVEALDWTMPATTGIKVHSDSSSHGHNIEVNGEHEHVATVDPTPYHLHDVVEDQVGNNVPIDITPEYLTVYSYIRS